MMKSYLLLKIVVTAVLLSIITGCGGGGGDSSSPQTSPSTNNSNNSGSENEPLTTVSGNVVDGPIYGATIRLYNISDLDLVNPIATFENATSDGTDGVAIGSYSLDIENLPDEYIITVSGGIDAGDDGVKGTIDDTLNTEVYSTINTKESATKSYVNGGTSMVAATLFSRGANDIENAKRIVNKSLGLDENIDLTLLDPMVDPIANKATKFVANLIKQIPATDRMKVMETTAKKFKEKVDNNETVATIFMVGFSIDDDNITNLIATDRLLGLDVNKIQKVKNASESIIDGINDLVKMSIPMNELIERDKINEIFSITHALNKIASDVETKPLDEMSQEKISTSYDNLHKNLEIILDDNISHLSIYNLESISEIFSGEDNLSIESLKSISKILNIDEKNLRNIAANTLLKFDLDNITSLHSLEEKFTDDSYKDLMVEFTDEIYQSAIASILLNDINLSVEDLNQKIENVKNTSVKDIFDHIETNYNPENDEIGEWLLETVHYNLNKGVNLDFTDEIDALYSYANLKLQSFDFNLTQIFALKFTVIKTDLNTSLDIVRLNNDLETWENSLNNLISNAYSTIMNQNLYRSFDIISSMECVEKEVYRNSTNYNHCIRFSQTIPKRLTLSDTLFKPLEVLGFSTPKLDFNINLNY